MKTLNLNNFKHITEVVELLSNFKKRGPDTYYGFSLNNPTITCLERTCLEQLNYVINIPEVEEHFLCSNYIRVGNQIFAINDQTGVSQGSPEYNVIWKIGGLTQQNKGHEDADGTVLDTIIFKADTLRLLDTSGCSNFVLKVVTDLIRVIDITNFIINREK